MRLFGVRVPSSRRDVLSHCMRSVRILFLRAGPRNGLGKASEIIIGPCSLFASPVETFTSWLRASTLQA